jgi:aminoglycoside phosphotransferase
MEKLKGGVMNNTFLDKREGKVVKKYDDSRLLSGLGIPKGQRLIREKLSLNRHDKENILTPKCISCDSNNSTLEMEYISGINLGDFLQSKYQKLDTAKKNELFTKIGEVLRAIHKPVNTNVENFITHFTYKITKKINKARPILEYEGIDTQKLLYRLKALINSQDVRKLGVTRVHRDFWQNNIIVDGTGELKGVVDWEFSGIGNPYEDFALIKFRLENKYPEASKIWAGYNVKPDEGCQQAFLACSALKVVSCLTLDDYLSEEYYQKIKPLISVCLNNKLFSEFLN